MQFKDSAKILYINTVPMHVILFRTVSSTVVPPTSYLQSCRKLKIQNILLSSHLI